MNETELENLVVNLTGDGSEYADMLEKAQDETEEFGEEIEDQTKKIEGHSNNITMWAKTALQALASFGASHFLKDSLGEWDLAERTAIKLSAAIKMNGGDVETLMAKYNKFATQLEGLTEMGDDATLAIIKQAESFGVSGDKAIKATKDAIGLAEASGSSAEATVRLTAAMAKGDIQRAMMFSRMIPQLRGVKNETEFLAKYNQLVTSGLESAQKQAGTATGALHQLENAYGNLKEEIGKVVGEAIKPFVEAGKDAIEWIQSFDEETKTAIATVALLTATVVGLTGAFTAAWTVFQLLTGGASLPVILAIGAAVAAAVGTVTLFVNELGGVEKTFEAIKEKANQAWAWLKPVRQALYSFWSFLQETAVMVWETIKKTAVDTWNSITSGAEVNWEQIRSTIVDAILMAEFTLRNFDKVAQLVWTTIQLGFLSMVEDFIFFFDTTLPELLDWFADQFPSIIIDAIDMATKVIQNRFDNLATLWNNLMEVFSGERSVGDLFQGLKSELDGVEARFTELPKLTKRGMTDAEQALADDAAKQLQALEEGWEAFRADKLNQFASEDNVAKAEEEAGIAGNAIGESFAEHAGQAIGKFDAVLAGSAESLARISEYQDRLNAKPGSGKSGSTTGGMPGSDQGMKASQSNPSAGTSEENRKQTEYLKNIAGYTKTIAEKPSVELATADF